MAQVCHREGPGGDAAESDKASDRCCFGFVWEFDRKPALSAMVFASSAHSFLTLISSPRQHIFSKEEPNGF